jgi:hypothetical protein
LFAFGLSGFLLDRYCPDPRLFTNEAGVLDTLSYAAATQNAHYIWYVFVGIGLISAIALYFYGKITKKIDSKNVA